MERLDACYFCGTAADAPLREVTISPRQRQGDPEATVQVTLCPTCEDKLERVLGGLFDHVESSRTEAETAVEPEAEPDEADEASETDTVDRIDVSSGDGDGKRRGRRRLFTESPSDDGPTEAAGGESATTAEAEGDDDARAEEDAEILDDDEPKVRARATANTSEAIDGVSVAEYNRVMRLLQNRDFPMARTAFVDLAASAYDLGEETVEAVLDAVIEQGSLNEREGQLVRDDEESP